MEQTEGRYGLVGNQWGQNARWACLFDSAILCLSHRADGGGGGFDFRVEIEFEPCGNLTQIPNGRLFVLKSIAIAISTTVVRRSALPSPQPHESFRQPSIKATDHLPVDPISC